MSRRIRIDFANTNVLTVEEAARFLRVGKNHLYNEIGRGRIPHRRVGRVIRLSRSALVLWLEGTCGVVAKKGPR